VGGVEGAQVGRLQAGHVGGAALRGVAVGVVVAEVDPAKHPVGDGGGLDLGAPQLGDPARPLAPPAPLVEAGAQHHVGQQPQRAGQRRRRHRQLQLHAVAVDAHLGLVAEGGEGGGQRLTVAPAGATNGRHLRRGRRQPLLLAIEGAAGAHHDHDAHELQAGLGQHR